VTYQPSPLRMKAVAASRRRTAPPHCSHTVNGGSEMRCRTSNVRLQSSHSYSYVGTEPLGNTRKFGVSRRAATALAVLVFAAAGCSSAAEKKAAEVQRLHARALYEQALANLTDRRVSLGMSALRQAIELDPQSALYRNALGVVLLDLKRPAEAQVELEKAVQLDPGFAEAQHNLGLSYAEQGRPADAVPAYRRALAIAAYTTPEVAYHNLGNAYLALGQLREAAEAYRAALQLEPKQVGSIYSLGVVLVREGRREEAKAAFRRARDLEPASLFGQAAAEALKNLGEGG
jgi:tetratricopeptide (TPR) repeat protein